MSSKIYRAGEEDGVEIEPVSWKPAHGATAQTHKPRVISAPGAENDARIVQVQQEAEMRVKAAYNQGLAAGESAAAQKAQQKIDPVLQGLSSVIGELAGARKKFRGEAEEDTVKLAIAIARRVLYRELNTDPEAILGIVKAAFAKLNVRETHRLRVSQRDAALLQEHRGKLQIPPGIEIFADASLRPGSAIFETSRGELDASVETQLAEIERGFADLMKRKQ